MYRNSFCARRLFALSCLFLFVSFAAIANQPDAKQLQASSAEGQMPLSLSADQSTIQLNSSAAPAQAEPRKSSSILYFLRMVLVLAVVIVLIYAVLRFMKRTASVGDTDDPFLRRVCSLSIGQGKSVQVVTILSHAYLVGVTDNGINLIGEITDKELVDSMNLYADKNGQVKKPRSFSDVLELFMQTPSKKQENAFRSTVDSLRQQRGRLNGDFGGSDE